MSKYASHWREAAAPVIARVLKETEGQSNAEIGKALRFAFPFGPYENHPRKIWLDEIRVQRRKKKIRPHPAHRQVESTAGQADLFGAK